jgi:tetratricopeptide (TPR) repeat protein
MTEEEIFHEALGRNRPEERAAYLQRACGGNPVLRAAVEALLRANVGASGFMNRPAPAPDRTVDEPPIAEGPGTVIGPYKLLEQIGEGGFGAVFMAEQQEPVRRKVALKVLKPGMDSKHVIARFEAERQALALMDHPNIARVHDGGATASGRPYFVMELVKGQPITEFCDQNQLTPKERLELFVHVCQAVQHAHQKGIIHRDLKPSNVLVSRHDTTPAVKVIDFGVAKALGQTLTDKTLFTGIAQMIGTPLYMSPEQAGMSDLDVDTRSDIYSLGVLLYELLTGTTPFTKERLQGAGYDEIRRIIREEEPPRPSTRISTLGRGATPVSTQRKSDPKRLSQLVRGELDWIVMKALEKDRSRRYETPGAFAADVQRYLHDEPVLACPPSAAYRFRKFARRHKTGLAVAGLILFFMASLAGGVGWVVRDQAARQAKVVNDLEMALDRAELYQKEGKRAEALAGFGQAKTLAREVPLNPGRDARLAQLKERLDADARDRAFIDRYDDIRLRVQSEVNVVEGHFRDDQTLPLVGEALRDFGIEIGVQSPAEAAALIQSRPESVGQEVIAALGDYFRWVPQDDAPTRQWLLDTLDAADRNDWRVRVRKASADRDWSTLKQLAGDVDAHKQPPSFLIRLARGFPTSMRPTRLELLRRTQRAHPADLWANHWLAFELREDGKPAEAVRYFTAALALRPENPGILLNRGNVLREAKELDEAITDFRHVLTIVPHYANAHVNLGLVLCDKRLFDEAIPEIREAIRLNNRDAKAHRVLGDALQGKGLVDDAIVAYREALRIDEDYADAHNNLGNALRRKEQFEEGIAAHREAIRINKNVAEYHNDLAATLVDNGRFDEAITEVREAIRLQEDVAMFHNNLGIALKKKGRLDEAIAAHRDAIRLQKDFADAHRSLGDALREKGLIDDAISAYRDALRIKKDYADAHNGLGICLRLKNQLDQAIVEYREAIRFDKGFAEAHYNLGIALYFKGRYDEAIVEYHEAIRLKENYPDAYVSLGNAHMLNGQPDQAEAALREAVRLDKDHAMAHNNLANILLTRHKFAEAVAEYHEAIRINKDYLEARLGLGSALCNQGEFRKALVEMRRAHEISGRSPHTAQGIRQYERLIELDEQLPGFLEGKTTPASPQERGELGWLCTLKQRNRAAVRFYQEAFAAKPDLGDDLLFGHRYQAACAAALAGCGTGTDTDNLDAPERARLRGQSQEWLRAELTAWRRLLDREPDKAGMVALRMRHWLVVDPDFASVRGKDALAKLPDAERESWQKLWDDVSALLERAKGNKTEK